MNTRLSTLNPGILCILAGCGAAVMWAQQQQPQPPQPKLAAPRAGKPALMRVSELKPGMQATAWTVFAGSEAEPVPVEIVGVLKNAWGPKQDIILGKMGGKAIRTNVAGGMSGSPVYINGKLIGAIALRMSVFSPDAICGITPIELMLEINDFDATVPAGARTPDALRQRAGSAVTVPASMLAGLPVTAEPLSLTPIDSPLVLSGFTEATLREFGPMFKQMGISLAQGGAGPAQAGATAAMVGSAKPVSGWQAALNPGEAISGLLVSGDMSMAGTGTVTYNDGKRVLAFGHPFLSLGPVSMPMAKSEILMTLASAFQPNKIANATDVVGALHQDRHSGIMGVLGEQAEMVPYRVKIRSFSGETKVMSEKDLNLQVFVQQKWTPFLMMVTLFNAVSSMNEFAEDVTYRISGNLEVEGQRKIALQNIFTQTEMPAPPPMTMALWWGDKFNRLFQNSIRMPRLKSVDVTLDLLPVRKSAMIDTAFADVSEVDAGGEVPVKVFLRPFRGGRIERSIKVKIPAAFPKGDHRILLSDADTLNRLQTFAGMSNRFIDLPQTVSLINQERTNNRLYVSLIQSRPTVYVDDKTLPSLPASVANVMQNGRSANRPMFTIPETASEQTTLTFDDAVSGSYSLRIRVN